MSSAYFVEIVSLAEIIYDVTSEQIASSSGRYPPAGLVSVRIRPQEVTHGSVVRHLLLTVNGPNLIDSGDGWRKTAVHAEYLAFDQAG